MIGRVLEGFNSTIFAYGPTGSGKTFTMQGSKDGESIGIIPRSLLDLYTQIEDRKNDTGGELLFNVSVTFVQLYKEKVYDLMTDEEIKDHKLRYNARNEFLVEDVLSLPVNSSQDAM